MDNNTFFDEIHIVMAVRARDLRKAAVVYRATKYRNSHYQDLQDGKYILQGPFKTMDDMHISACLKVLSVFDLSMFSSVIVYMDSPLPDFSKNTDFQNLNLKTSIIIDSVTHSTSGTYKKCVEIAQDMMSEF